MMRLPLVLLFSALCAAPVMAQGAGEDALEKHVNKGLAYLAKTQDAEGFWRVNQDKSPAVTSLAVMAFLSAGHVPGEGLYAGHLDKAVRWMADTQQPAGVSAVGPGGFVYGGEMYAQGISTLMLTQVAGMTDAKLAAKVKQAVEQGVKVILKGQRLTGPHKGGWRYSVESPDADLSVTGWQLLALKGARNLGCDVPAERIKLALDYIKASQEKKTGGFHYTLGGPVTAPCTATAILCLELCEGHHTEAAKRGGAYLLQHPPTWNDMYFSYHAYYCAQATFQLGGNYWEFYRPRLQKILFGQQSADGSWSHPMEAMSPGASYSTAMSVLALTVEYRYLPIYQRGDD